jgi:hypothetical protein
MSLWDTSMPHMQGIAPVSDQRLQRRNGVYYYRRRVPLHLVDKIGKKVVQESLHTTNLKEAKKRRTLRDLEWDARFAACSSPANGADGPEVHTTALGQPLSDGELLRPIRDYVERRDRTSRKREAKATRSRRRNGPQYRSTPRSRHRACGRRTSCTTDPFISPAPKPLLTRDEARRIAANII